jgi:hypothetical protein
MAVSDSVPQRTSPPISATPRFHCTGSGATSDGVGNHQLTRPGGSLSSSSQSFAFSILLAIDSTSFSVSSLEMAARTSKPLPIWEMSSPSTVTEADLTLCNTAVPCQCVARSGNRGGVTCSSWCRRGRRYTNGRELLNHRPHRRAVRAMVAEPGVQVCRCAGGQRRDRS